VAEPRQRPIPVTSKERAALEQQKRRYEQSTGDTGDWGNFLGTVALLGLAALGIYSLARATRRSEQSVDVQCAVCQQSFLMAVPDEVGQAVYIRCPHCNEELVVNLGTSR
jgi:DNA-directed RNA polymerase subunit RPC12/RpoP